MTPLDWFNALMALPMLILSSGWILFPVLVVLVFGYALIKHVVWPALCDFGNWLGRE